LSAIPVRARWAERGRLLLVLGGEHAGQLLDGTLQVIEATVRVALRGRVPGQLLEGAEVDAGPAAASQVGVAQGVEVGVQRAVRALDGT
jgi:hypothetical protein